MTIKTVVFSALGALAMMAVGKFTWEAQDSWRAYSRALDQRSFSASADQFIKGTYVILLERLATDNALQAPAAADDSVRAKIDAFRKSIAEQFDPALKMIEQRSFANKAALIDDLKAKLDRANDVRRQADASIRQPREQRDEALRKGFAPTVTAMVNASLSLWYTAVYATAKGDSDLEQLAVVKEIGWKMREFSGIARAAVAGAIAAGTPIPADRLPLIADNGARVTALWLVLENLAKDPQTSPAIIQAMQEARDKYFKGFVPLVEEMRKVGEGGKYPMSAAQFVDTTNPQIDSLLAVMRAAGAASDGRTQQLIDAAFDHLLFALAVLVLCIAIAAGSGAAVLVQVTRPLTALAGAMRKLAEGNYDVTLPGLERNNEVGDVAQVAELLKVKAIERAELEARAKQTEAERAAERKAEMHRLADQFQQAVGQVVGTVSSTATQLEAAATTLTKTADATQQRATVVAAASEEASTNVQTVASATEEMSSSIGEIGRQVQESNKIANEAVSQAQRTDDRILKLSQAASRIGDVTQLITSIAEQTNLLALNATIEAARAGEAGKGFAVVAQEVKQLAAQTAKATNEISSQITEMQSATQDSVAAIKEIGGTITRISEIATTIASAVEEQGAATHEIARNVQQAAAGTTQVATNITEVNRGAAETGAASAQVLSSARSLAGESNRLKAEMDKFMATVRAA
ncbi:MAG TPA: HAMP domain-containing methyl-accepting chemotaxis protein [Xanthobacteraceae bacterium]|nr:HAMP domain-containing methyl-accepting chemotaxis protein [Xanthobacteraceae bacterium]